jgi:hypothetical protein
MAAPGLHGLSADGDASSVLVGLNDPLSEDDNVSVPDSHVSSTDDLVMDTESMTCVPHGPGHVTAASGVLSASLAQPFDPVASPGSLGCATVASGNDPAVPGASASGSLVGRAAAAVSGDTASDTPTSLEQAMAAGHLEDTTAHGSAGLGTSGSVPSARPIPEPAVDQAIPSRRPRAASLPGNDYLRVDDQGHRVSLQCCSD